MNRSQVFPYMNKLQNNTAIKRQRRLFVVVMGFKSVKRCDTCEEKLRYDYVCEEQKKFGNGDGSIGQKLRLKAEK